MASKRKANDSDIPAEKPKRRSEDTIGEEIVLSNGDNYMSMAGERCGCIVVDYARLKAICRQVVREEVSAAQNQPPRLTPNSNLGGGISEVKQHYQLQFSNKLKGVYYTEKQILAEGDAAVQIVLLDVGSHSIVTEGPMSSAEIEICVVPGDFGSDGHQNWSRKKFNDNIIVRPREGRKALLKGEDTRVTLKDGAAFIPDIEFTDISRWVRAGTFRLAARSKEASVKEAISRPFSVKDKRGASIMKHDQPSLDSEIWRLNQIRKGGNIHKQLSDNGIETVKDFMRLYTTNPSSLKEKCGKIPSGKWEAIKKNARACVIDDNVHYSYDAKERRLCLVFNSIYEVVRVSFDNGQTYRSPETFTSAEKRLVEVAKKEAYENDQDFVELKENLEELGTVQVGQSSNGMPIDGVSPPQVDPPATQQGKEYDSWDLRGGSQSICFPLYDLVKYNAYENMETSIYGSSTKTLAGHGQPSTSTSLGESIRDEQVGTDQMVLNSTRGGELLVDGDDWEPRASELELENWLSPLLPVGPGYPFEAGYYYCPDLASTSGTGKGKTVWNKIRHAFRLERRFVAKRKAKLSIPCG